MDKWKKISIVVGIFIGIAFFGVLALMLITTSVDDGQTSFESISSCVTPFDITYSEIEKYNLESIHTLIEAKFSKLSEEEQPARGNWWQYVVFGGVDNQTIIILVPGIFMPDSDLQKMMIETLGELDGVIDVKSENPGCT
ncbi:MAG TPA: hypothetical protein VH562_02755 [Nitrosopumilaceae archaeon]